MTRWHSSAGAFKPGQAMVYESSPRIPVTTVVACPDCKAAIGSPCVSTKGTPMSPHTSRKRIAFRKYNQDKD